MGWQVAVQPVLIAGNTVIINQLGMFVYGGTPASGNLLFSVAPVAGTDAYGNTYPLGIGVPPNDGQIDGSVITDGTIPASAVSFTATDIGGNTSTISDTEPANPNVGDTWFDAANGYELNQWDGTEWDAYQFGTNAITAGSITADLIAANAIVAGMIAAGAIDGMVINSPLINGGTISATDLIVSGENGGLFAYGSGGGGQIVQSFTDSTTWTAPDGVTSVMAEAWAGGGSGAAGNNSNGGGGGGGGGEYAAEDANTVVPGETYTITVGAAGEDSGFSGPSATTVTANAGSNASGTSGGAGGTGSSNSVHENGGTGGAGSSGTSTTTTFNAGSGHWVCPAGVTSVTAECWGAASGGDGGGLAGGANSGGYGGAGGAYASKTITVIPGDSYSYAVGSGGTGGTPDHNGASASGPTWFDSQSTVYADYATVSSEGASTPGFAINSVGSVTESGGNPGHATGSGGGGGGSSAGKTAFGNPGQSVSGSTGGLGGAAPFGGHSAGNGGNANDPGHGGNTGAAGGGGGGGSSAGAGGSGGDGQLILTYVLPGNAGGGGGGGSGTAAVAGNNGNNGSSANGGSGASAQPGGGPGGAGGNDGIAGTVPTMGPGGGGGGGGAAVAGASGKSGQVRLTYTIAGTATLVASIAGAAGTDPVVGGNVPAGYLGPVTATSAGGISGGPDISLFDDTAETNANAGTQPATMQWPIPAGDAQVGTVYQIETQLSGTTATSGPETLGFKPYLNSAVETTSNGDTIGATAMPAATPFTAKMRLMMRITATGASGAANIYMDGGYAQTANIQSGSGTNSGYMSSQATSVAINTTVPNTIGIATVWGGSSAGQTVTARGSVFTRKCM